MRRGLLGLLLVASCSSECGESCGNSAIGINGAGQVKRVSRETPLLCSAYNEVDISLGIMRGGVGSMSTNDLFLVVLDPDLVPVLRKAAAESAIVDFEYDQRRFAPCLETRGVLRKVSASPPGGK